MFSSVVAHDDNKGIGQNNKIPWKCFPDLVHFKKLTSGHVIIMGRKTFESMNAKPLQNRVNIIISTTMIANDIECKVEHGKVEHGKVEHGKVEHGKVEQGKVEHGKVEHGKADKADKADKTNENPLGINTLKKFGKAFVDVPSNGLRIAKGLMSRNDVSQTTSAKSVKTVNKDTPATIEELPFLVFNDPWKCVEYCCKTYKDKKLFVIGGSEIYKWFYTNGLIGEEYCTNIKGNYNCDKFYPVIDSQEISVLQEQKELIHSTPAYVIKHYKVRNREEEKFLGLAEEILTSGNSRIDRTSIGTISLFGQQLKFNLTNHTFPLLTSRKMAFKWIFEELILYLRGQTDSKILEKKGINVWTGNTTRSFLDGRGLQHMPIGDMGASYGFLFRHFGGKYQTCDSDYKGVGVDQLADVIDQLKNNPYSRRIIISLWDPTNLNNCPLPPCLYNYQFYVHESAGVYNTNSNGSHDASNNTTTSKHTKYLTCMMTQRSSDFAVAGGWNVATGALLTYLLAAVCGMEPYELIWNIGDVHIYNNLIAATKEQITRQPFMFPKLFVEKKDNIESYEFTDIKLIGYKSHDAIKLTMNV